MRPLEGIKVLDFTHGLAGPFTTTLLGDLGCDVIKIEKPGRGDPTRYLNISERFQKGVPNGGSDYFMGINRNKRAITVDLDTEKGRQIALDLARWADVSVQNFRPGVMKKLGLDYDALKEVNPKLIYASVSAYGLEGPLAHQPGMDVSIQARSGILSVTGHKGGEPARSGASIADLSGGLQMTVAILSALLYRDRTGIGQEVHVSLLDCTVLLLLPYSLAVMDGGAVIAPMGSGHPQLVPFQAFPTSDGFIVIGTATNKLYRAMCTALGLEELIDDPRFKTNPDRVRHREELVPLIAAKTRERPGAEWLSLFESRGIPSAPVNSLKASFDDPQLRMNGMVVESQHPVHGTIHLLGIPYDFGECTLSIDRWPPVLGEHTDEVLTSVLGMSQDQVETLRSEGVV